MSRDKKPSDNSLSNKEEVENRLGKLKEIHRNNISQKRPKPKDQSLLDKKEIKKLNNLNKTISNFFKFNSEDLESEERKKRTGILVFSFIIIVLLFSAYYFLIYEPYQEELNNAKTSKLNELNSLYKGPLATSTDAFQLKKEIENSNSLIEVKMVDILRPATKSWQNYQLKSIRINTDNFNRTMAVFETNETKNVIMNVVNATHFIKTNDATVLSNIKFEKPDTVAIPISINRLQAGGGLLALGSIVDIYSINSNSNNTNQTNGENNLESISISGCTVLAILRYDESGLIEADYSKTHTIVSGNETNPNEDLQTFSTNVEEMLKGGIAGGFSESEMINLFDSYGIKLSDYERRANIGDLDSEYILLIEVPKDKAQFILKNMDNIIITIPTEHAPNWMSNELSKTYL